jgi:hypothetical protein
MQNRGVRVSVGGELVPRKLPRRGGAPVSVTISSRISSTAAAPPPQLRRIVVQINRNGHLAASGIPNCRIGHIDPSTTAEALAECRDSLIGEGSFSAKVRIPEQSPFPSEGKVLAFNGRFRGRPAVLAHVFGRKPVPTSYVLPFVIGRTKGKFGTVLTASLPQATGDWGYVTGLSLRLSRRFLAGGRSRSYVTAGCPAPPGFSGAVFPLLRTTFVFAEALSLTPTVTRSCEVRK